MAFIVKHARDYMEDKLLKKVKKLTAHFTATLKDRVPCINTGEAVPYPA